MKPSFIASASRVVLRAAKATPGEMLAPWAGFYRAAKEMAGTGEQATTSTTVAARKGGRNGNSGKK